VARSIENTVRKNLHKKAQQNKKPASKAEWTYYYGKSYLFPILLLLLSGLSAFTLISTKNPSIFYYVTVVAYLGLAIFYYVKKPYLRVGKDFISTRRLGSDRSLEADQISGIEVYDGYILIVIKNKRAKWVFAKAINRYPVVEMAEALEKFAKANKVPFQNELRG
jgi:hypothetical protein